MSLGLSRETHTHLALPQKSIGELPTSTPTAGVSTVAHGRVKDSTRVMVDVSGACVLTLYVFSPGPAAWRLPSAASTGYQITFTAAGMDYFDAPLNSLVYIKSDTGSITCYADLDDAFPTRLI